MKIEEKYVGARVRVSAQGTAVGKRKKKNRKAKQNGKKERSTNKTRKD